MEKAQTFVAKIDMGLLISSILLLAFAALALVDGLYLHIIKYKLYSQPESRFEHLTHSIRAILFPAILYFLFVKQGSSASFYLGILLVCADIGVLGIDAFVEKDSRAFMGGLPRWEYILHLFVNGFHFASIAVFLALKLDFTESGIVVVPDLSESAHFKLFQTLVLNLIPGAVLIALVHVVTILRR